MVTTPTSSHVEENTNSNLHTISGKMIDGARAGTPGRDQLFRSSPRGRPGAARGSESKRHQMERSR